MNLGGGAGVYTVPLAKKGYQVTLADLSERLIEQAKEKVRAESIENVVADVVNAIYQEVLPLLTGISLLRAMWMHRILRMFSTPENFIIGLSPVFRKDIMRLLQR